METNVGTGTGTMNSSYHESFHRKNQELIFDIELKKVREQLVDEVVVDAPKFLFRIGREPISLTQTEFRIIRFLAGKPYKAFRRDQIIDAVNSLEHPVTDESLDHHIRELRGKLGMFSDYVQTVPYIGFRFKP